MTQEQEKLYEFLDQLKAWQQQLSDDAKENEKHAKTLKIKDRKKTYRYVSELESQAYAISQVYAEFEEKFDLGFKEVETSKVESKTLPGVFYDVIKLERLNGETKFRLKLNGEYCCQPSSGVCGIGVLKFTPGSNVDLLVGIADCDKDNIAIVENSMRAAGFEGDYKKTFRSCKIDKDVQGVSVDAGEITSFRPIK